MSRNINKSQHIHDLSSDEILKPVTSTEERMIN